VDGTSGAVSIPGSGSTSGPLIPLDGCFAAVSAVDAPDGTTANAGKSAAD
jgi:hypothetical protein